MNTYALRLKLVEIARRDVGRTEASKNRAPWIRKLWDATTYPDGMANREPYCAAGVAYCVMEWGKLSEVRAAFGMSGSQFEKWRCKSASVFSAPKNNWVYWAQKNGLRFISPDKGEFHAGDLIIFKYSHMEIYIDDDDSLAPDGILDIGYNTDGSGGREGDGCFEKPRTRSRILHVVRLLA